MTRSLLGAVLAGLLLAACGGGDATGGETASSKEPASAGREVGSGHPVTISAFDLYFEPKEIKVPAGQVDVTYVNEGAIYHTLKVEGTDGFALEVTNHGERAQGAIDLEPGTYAFYCDLPGHRVAGMEAKVIAE